MEKYLNRKNIDKYEKIIFIVYALFLVGSCTCLILKPLDSEILKTILLRIDNVFFYIFGIFFFGYWIKSTDKSISSFANGGIIAGIALAILGTLGLVGSFSGFIFDGLLVVFYVQNKKVRGKTNDHKKLIYDIVLTALAGIGFIFASIIGTIIIAISLVLIVILKFLIVDDDFNLPHCPKCSSSNLTLINKTCINSRSYQEIKSYDYYDINNIRSYREDIIEVTIEENNYTYQCSECKHAFTITKEDKLTDVLY